MTARPETRSQGASTPAGPEEANSRASVRFRPRVTVDWATNEAASAARSRTQPTPRATRPPDCTADQTYRIEQRAEPACHRHAREKPETADLLIAGLPRQLDSQNALRPHPLGLDLLALELETLMIAVERLFQRSDHHARQARLERTSAFADRQLIGIRRRRQCALSRYARSR